MTTDAAALIEQILAEIQCVRSLRHAVVGMTHLTAGFGVFFMKERMQPKRIEPVRLHHARRCTPIASVTGGTPKLFRIVNLQKFLTRVADKGRGEIVRLLARPGRRHIRCLNI